MTTNVKEINLIEKDSVAPFIRSLATAVYKDVKVNREQDGSRLVFAPEFLNEQFYPGKEEARSNREGYYVHNHLIDFGGYGKFALRLTLSNSVHGHVVLLLNYLPEITTNVFDGAIGLRKDYKGWLNLNDYKSEEEVEVAILKLLQQLAGDQDEEISPDLVQAADDCMTEIYRDAAENLIPSLDRSFGIRTQVDRGLLIQNSKIRVSYQPYIDVDHRLMIRKIISVRNRNNRRGNGLAYLISNTPAAMDFTAIEETKLCLNWFQELESTWHQNILTDPLNPYTQRASLWMLGTALTDMRTGFDLRLRQVFGMVAYAVARSIISNREDPELIEETALLLEELNVSPSGFTELTKLIKMRRLHDWTAEGSYFEDNYRPCFRALRSWLLHVIQTDDLKEAERLIVYLFPPLLKTRAAKAIQKKDFATLDDLFNTNASLILKRRGS